MRSFGSFAFANVISSIQDHGTVKKKKRKRGNKEIGKGSSHCWLLCLVEQVQDYVDILFESGQALLSRL